MKQLAKILIIGNAGSGKTTLSYQIAELFDTQEIINLDKLVWGKNWEPVKQEIKEIEFNNIISDSSWIVDGVSLTILQAANIIIYLDFPRYICCFRALKRTFKYAFRSRPELPDQPSDIYIIGKVLKIIWQFSKRVHPKIIKHIAEETQRKTIFHIKNKKNLLVMLKALACLVR